MAPRLPSDIAELKQALDICAKLDAKCQQLAAAVAQYQANVAAAAKPDPTDPAVPPDTDDNGNPFPIWRPLTLAQIPGLSQLIDIIEPPLQIIVVILTVIATLLQILAAILFGLPDIFRILILAAYELLKAIIEDLLNTGAYLYADIPPFDTTSPQSVAASMGFPSRDPNSDPFTAEFVAGKTGAAPPPITPDGFQVWAQRFIASFDDPGDTQRPTAHVGAPVQAVFICMALPSLDALKQLMYLLGQLLNLDKFKRAWELFVDGPDPRRARARMQSVAPDWKAMRLQDIFPPLRALLLLPEMLKALLLAVSDITSLLKNLAQALADKAQVLLKLAAAVQAIIDLLEALKATGFYVLPVQTMDGVDGLKSAFLSAQNRPTGGYVGGVCFLASGPNIGAAAGLFGILGVSGFDPPVGVPSISQAFGAAGDMFSQAGSAAASALDGFSTTADQIMQNLSDAIAGAPPTYALALGTTPDELQASITGNAVTAIGNIETIGVQASNYGVDPNAVNNAVGASQRARTRGRRSLAMGFGTSTGLPPPQVQTTGFAGQPPLNDDGTIAPLPEDPFAGNPPPPPAASSSTTSDDSSDDNLTDDGGIDDEIGGGGESP